MGSTSLTYLYDLSGRVVAEDNGTSWGPGYVYVGHQLLALYSGGTSGATYFVHADHLGSSRVLTAMNQSVYDKPDYLPFGEQIAGDTATSHKFTGYPRDADTGLDYASARYYGSRLGRFLTPDPLGMGAASLTNPQSLNQYAYVGDNPTNMTDPSGMDPCGDFMACGDGGGFGGGVFGGPPTIPNWTGINLPGIGGYNPWNLPGAGSINQCDFVECGLTYDPASDPSLAADPAKGSDDKRSEGPGFLCDKGYIDASKNAWQQSMGSIGKKKEAGFWTVQDPNGGYQYDPIPASSGGPDCRISGLTAPDNTVALTHDHPPGCGGVISSPSDRQFDQLNAGRSKYPWYVISPQGQGRITDSGYDLEDPGYTWMQPCKGSK